MLDLASVEDQRGQAAVELTLGFLLFFSIFMAVVEFSHLLYTKVTLQHALRSAGRYMVTGQTSTDGNGNSVARSDAIHDVFCANVIATGLQCPSLGPKVFSPALWKFVFSVSMPEKFLL